MPRDSLAGRVKDFDLAIVGRGIAGLALAREILIRTKLTVAIIGPDTPVSGSATVVAQGVSAIKGLVIAKEPLFAAKLAGHRMLPDWIGGVSRASGRPIASDSQGVGEITKDIPDFQARMGRSYQGRFQGIFGPLRGTFASPLTGAKAFGVLHPEDLWFDPVEALMSLESLLLKAEGRIEFLPRRVLALGDARDQTLLLDGDERIKAARVVIAAGFASPDLLPSGSLPAGWRLVGGETFISPSFISPSLPSRPAQFVCDDAGEPGRLVSSFVRGTFSVSRLPDGRVVAGSTTGKAPGEFRDSPLNSMSYELSLLAPAASQDTSLAPQGWTSRWGLRLRSKDRSPVCGALPGFENRIWVFSGFYKNGLQLAPLLATCLTQAMATNDENHIPSEFRASRFGP